MGVGEMEWGCISVEEGGRGLNIASRDDSPPALRLRAAQRAGGHDTTLKKLLGREDPNLPPRAAIWPLQRSASDPKQFHTIGP